MKKGLVTTVLGSHITGMIQPECILMQVHNLFIMK